MKIFVSHAWTGEDSTEVTERLRRIRDLLEKLGISYHINPFADGYDELTESNAPPAEYLRFAFKQLQDSDLVLVVLTSPRRSEGILMEVGASVWLNKRIILAQHVSSVDKTYLPTLAEYTFLWKNEDELAKKLTDYFSNQVSRR